MAVEIGALRALLSLDTAAFEKGAKRARTSMTGLERSLSKTAAKMKSIGTRMSMAVTAPLVGATSLLVKSSLSAIDAQSKMAQSLGTSTKSMQVLARAADRAGISTGELEQVGRQLTKRLSQAATGTGPAVDALARLGLKASDLANMDLDQKIAVINRAIADTVPKAQQAAISMALFGDRAGIMAGRLDSATIAAANAELERFGVTVTEIEADKIEEANDAISALGLVMRGLGNQMAVALAPTLKAIAERVAHLGSWFSDLAPQMRTLIVVAGGVAAAIGPVLVGLGLMASGMSVAIGATRALTAALFTMRGALMATGIGAVVVAAGMLANWFLKLSERTGDFGTALGLLFDVGSATFSGIGNTALGLVEIMAGVASGITGSFVAAFAQIAKVWDALINGMASAWNVIAEKLNLGTLGKSNLSGNLGGLSEDLFNNAAGSIESGLTRIVNAGAGVAKAVAAMRAETVEATGGMDDAAQAAADLKAALDGGGAGGIGTGGKGGGAGGKKSDATKEAERKAEAIQRVIAGLKDEISLVGKSEAQRRALQEVRAAGVDLYSKEGQKIAGLVQQLTALEAQETAMQKIAERVNAAFESIGDAMAGAIVQGKSMGEALGRVFQQIAQDLIASGISRMIKSLFGGAGGGGGGGIGSAIASLIPGFANGTNSAPGGLAWVGERGRELVNLPKGSQVIPNHKLPLGGGGRMQIELVGGSLTLSDDGRIMAEVNARVGNGVKQGLGHYDRALPNRLVGFEQDRRARR